MHDVGDEFPRRLCDPLLPVILFYHVSLQPTSGNVKQQSQGVGGHRVYVGICLPHDVKIFVTAQILLDRDT